MTPYDKAYTKALRMADDGMPAKDVLSFLTVAAERAIEVQSISSILLLDDKGLLRNGASPKLPSDYLLAIDGIKPDPNVGTCAAAAATGCVVITESFYQDDKWAELRHLPLALGLKGAWSVPIVSNAGKVLGTFGTYFNTSRRPSPDEIDGISLIARAAAHVVESAHFGVGAGPRH